VVPVPGPGLTLDRAEAASVVGAAPGNVAPSGEAGGRGGAVGIKQLAGGVLAVALLVGVAGCGGDDEPTGMTKEQYIAKAEAICKKTRKTIEELEAELDPKDQQAPSRYIQQVSTELLAEIDELRDLGFPEGDERRLDGAFTVYEDNLIAWQDNPSSALQGANSKEILAAAKTLEDYGLPSCGAGL
jgi:hypothetical protein